MMKKLMKNGGVMCEEAYDEHQVISGRTANKLDAEELEIYRFLIGGMQAK